MQESFDRLVDLAMQELGGKHMRPVIEKELLHYDILFALDQAKLLDTLTFQGGTSLRLCYGAPRFSEDLDFAGGPELNVGALSDIKQCLEDYLGSRYGLLITVRQPKQVSDTMIAEQADTKNTTVAKWQISIQTAPRRRDIPRQQIKLEVASIPAYTRELKSLQRNYPFVPDGYSDVLIGVESLDEIMADKLVSLPSCDKYVRYRDIWDLRWLKQQGAVMDVTMVSNKIRDYGETTYPQKLQAMIDQIDLIPASSGFQQEMGRFIPQDVQTRTLDKQGFSLYLATEVKALLTATQQAIQNPTSLHEVFRM